MNRSLSALIISSCIVVSVAIITFEINVTLTHLDQVISHFQNATTINYPNVKELLGGLLK